MWVELFNNGHHVCMMLSKLAPNAHSNLLANQFMIASHNEIALLDFTGSLSYNHLFIAKQRYFPYARLKYILVSHNGPHVFSLLGKWPVHHTALLLAPCRWQHFIPHEGLDYQMDGRILDIPDRGMDIELGESVIKALPAHFMYSEGNFQFYDVESKILFSGAVGASYTTEHEPMSSVAEFQPHLPLIESFHRRYLASNKVCRMWAQMVRQLDLEWIIPQVGPPIKGAKAIHAFLNWIEQIECGVDLMEQSDYRVP